MKSKKTLRKVPVVVITPLGGVTADDILAHDPIINLVRSEVPACIEEAVIKKKDKAILFQINNLGYYLELSREDWVPALDSCIEYYSEMEDFEMCSKIQSIKNSIDKK